MVELQQVEGVVGAPAEEEGDDDGDNDLEGLLVLGQAVALQLEDDGKVSGVIVETEDAVLNQKSSFCDGMRVNYSRSWSAANVLQQ